MTVLDFACGGDVTADLAEMVGPTGRAIGTDHDDVKIALTREETAARGITNEVPSWWVAGHRREPTGRPPGPPKVAKDKVPRKPRSTNSPAPT